MPVARLPCLLFGRPPPAACPNVAQAPSRPRPPRSSVTQVSGSSSPCCGRSLLVIFYTFEPGIASLHKENNTFFKKIMIFDPILPCQNRLWDLPWASRSGPFLALCLSKVPLKYNTFALGTQKCAPGEHKGDIFVKRQTYSLKICFLYSFKAHFWMVPIFDDFAPSLFSPSASGPSLPSSEAPFWDPLGGHLGLFLGLLGCPESAPEGIESPC